MVLRHSWNSNVHYHVHKSPQLDSILSQINLVHTPTLYIFKFHFIIILPSTLRSLTRYSDEAMGRTAGVRFPVGARRLFFSHRYRVQTGSGTHPASYPVGAGGSFPEIKRPGREADHSPPSSSEVKNT